MNFLLFARRFVTKTATAGNEVKSTLNNKQTKTEELQEAEERR